MTMTRGLSVAIRCASTKAFSAGIKSRKHLIHHEPSKAHLQAATHLYRKEKGTRSPATDNRTTQGTVDSSVSAAVKDSHNNTDDPTESKRDGAPSLWRIGGTSQAYQESATAAWRNRKRNNK
ncbi:expressed unknown protein [Seminavis robusta]|uniref:Uncharacterized protein n=1 Tax=Seminavis robusta TaxID=568900 RepID=A0A9N8H9G6_9STRA|nr:expressed unknown protein [Seminavis robusta]|eukprot:Sro253_g100040.1 n/a (122) ;mRNA; f:78224-78589